jgi:F0F1-type ATP synthase assembly protein I
MRSGSPNSGDLSQDSGGRPAHRSPVTRTGATTTTGASGAARGGKQFYNALSASSIGLELGLSVVLCVVLGLWADARLDTKPWLMLAGLGLGLAAGFRSLLRNIARADRAAEQEAREADRG